MVNIFELPSKDGNITPEKARKLQQMQFHDKTAYVWMGILSLKKRVNRDKCSSATKQRMFGVFAIDEILCYRGTRFPGSRTLCHPACNKYCHTVFVFAVGINSWCSLLNPWIWIPSNSNVQTWEKQEWRAHLSLTWQTLATPSLTEPATLPAADAAWPATIK